MAQRLEQATDAIIAVGRTDQHRYHLSIGEFAGKITEHFRAAGLHIAQQFFHQLLVMVGQSFQHLETRFLFAPHIGDVDQP